MKQPSITSLPTAPEEEQRARMIKYTIAMSIRVVCLVLMLFVEGWWLAVCVAGAIILPYVAVVLANVGTTTTGAEVIRPGAVVPIGRPAPGAGEYSAPSESGSADERAGTDDSARPDESARDADPRPGEDKWSA
ncbi:DUF3099 domain-containing protein [Mycetocola zhujimingii]|uniref:DUF3099 domain-containing protein n=1 Tax=Mycetocola zhujimingii TaxID=2079792 RepID=A0A2U1TGA5_9MICO|nr:DUF3099 domain-containing protein [Mycetocola zhujimingii]PWC07922.1 DUF3099 domain-containing protein [Mycetocola zhujimingii]